MNDTLPDREPRGLCESITLRPTWVVAPAPRQREPVLSEEYVRCPNDAAGRYRILPDEGEAVAVWLCADHREEYDERVVETLEVV